MQGKKQLRCAAGAGELMVALHGYVVHTAAQHHCDGEVRGDGREVRSEIEGVVEQFLVVHRPARVEEILPYALSVDEQLILSHSADAGPRLSDGARFQLHLLFKHRQGVLLERLSLFRGFLQQVNMREEDGGVGLHSNPLCAFEFRFLCAQRCCRKQRQQ